MFKKVRPRKFVLLKRVFGSIPETNFPDENFRIDCFLSKRRWKMYSTFDEQNILSI